MMVIRLSTHGWCVLLIGAFVILLYCFTSYNHIGRLEGDVISVRRLLARCIHLSEEAGGLIKYIYHSNHLDSHAKHLSGGLYSEPVTEADLLSNQLIVSGIHTSFPDLKIRSEEHENPRHEINNIPSDTFHSDFQHHLPNDDLFVPVHNLVIWVDPLDPTKEFSEGLLEYVTVMICIVLHDQPIAGIIHQPFLNKTYWAWNSYASSPDLRSAVANRLKSAENRRNDSIFITYSRSHSDESLGEILRKRLAPVKLSLLPAGGSGYKTLNVVSGTADLYIHPYTIKRWDICAAQAVLEATGGLFVDLDNIKINYDAKSDSLLQPKTGLFAIPDRRDHDYWIRTLHSVLSKS